MRTNGQRRCLTFDHDDYNDSLVEETGGRLQLTDRGYLVTKEVFDPLDPLVVTGQATMNNGLGGFLSDVLSIAIRSNAVPMTLPGGPERFGEVDEGIVFTVRSSAAQNALLQIHAHNDGEWQSNGLAGTEVPGVLFAGVPFNFMITDDGFNLGFSIWATGTQPNGPNLTAMSAHRNSVDGHVAFYNRETAGPGSIHHNVAQLDNIAIVPEPSSVWYITAAVLTLIACVSFRRRSPRHTLAV